jgi:hypothetical protein
MRGNAQKHEQGDGRRILAYRPACDPPLEDLTGGLGRRGRDNDVVRDRIGRVAQGRVDVFMRQARVAARALGLATAASTYAEATAAARPTEDLSEPSARAAFVRSSPPMSVPLTKTWGNVGQPLHNLMASRSFHFEK